MSSEMQDATSTAPFSPPSEAAKKRTETIQDGTVEPNPSRMLDEDHNAQKLLTSWKSRHNSNQEELETLKTRAADLQTRREKYEKTKDEIAARINNITAKIREEKLSEIEKLSVVGQSVKQLYNSLMQTESTPEALNRIAEGLRGQKQEVELECKRLDAALGSKKAQLQQAQMQSVNSVASEEVISEIEESKVAVEIVREEAEQVRRLLGRLTLKKDQLIEEIDRLSLP